MRGAEVQNHYITATLPKLISLICQSRTLSEVKAKWGWSAPGKELFKSKSYVSFAIGWLSLFWAIMVYCYHLLTLHFVLLKSTLSPFQMTSRAISGRENFHSALSFSTRKKGGLAAGWEERVEFWYAPLREGWGSHSLSTCHFSS